MKRQESQSLEMESPIGDSFDSYVAELASGLDQNGRELLEAFRGHYSLASQIIELRKRNHLTQAQLAAQARVNQSDISRLERGTGNASQAALERIARVFRASLGFLPEG
ncbi:MAG TPA: helix-turn-helix transcriptional regulator [Candidatus Dormibacteraeota bacterium]|nr:helix-turn-helix transcriptional regulator [Candidatus Dormibacteraeota bacterium]